MKIDEMIALALLVFGLLPMIVFSPLLIWAEETSNVKREDELLGDWLRRVVPLFLAAILHWAITGSHSLYRHARSVFIPTTKNKRKNEESEDAS